MKKYRRAIFFAIEAALFLLVGAAFFQGMQIFISDLSSFSHLSLTLPMTLSYFMLSYWLFAFHLATHPLSRRRLNLTIKVNGVILTALGAILLVLAVVNFAQSWYVIGFVNILFPFDIMAIDAASILIGLLTLSKKDHIIQKTTDFIPSSRNFFFRLGVSIFGSFYVLIEEYFIGAFILGFDFANWSSPTLLWAIPFYALIVLGSAFLAYRELFLIGNERIIIPDKSRLIVGISLVGLTTLLSGYVIILNFTPLSSYVTENLQAYVSLDFMASINAGPYLVSVPPLIAACLYFFIFLAKRPKKEQVEN